MSKVKKVVASMVCVVLGVVFLRGMILPRLVNAASTDKVSIEQFAKELEAVAKADQSLMKENEFERTTQNVTWKEAVVLTNRADVLLNGESYNEKLYKQVKEKKRLTGLSELNGAEQKAARLCFVKGMIIGDSMGLYSQARKLQVDVPLTRAEVDKLVDRLKNKKQRVKLSLDGQVIRTTNLPKNAKYYSYILASFPNEFYEEKFAFQFATYSYKPVRLKDYAYPKDMFRNENTYNTGYQVFQFKDIYEKYGDMWMEKLKTNLECRLNFDYRTVDNEWISKLNNTYYIYEDAETDKRLTDSIKRYVNTAKKNHVVVKAAQIVIEPSAMYEDLEGYYVRCHLKFKVTADQVYTVKSQRQHELIYSSFGITGLRGLENGVWYEDDFDIVISGTAYGDDGRDFAVSHDSIAWYGKPSK